MLTKFNIFNFSSPYINVYFLYETGYSIEIKRKRVWVFFGPMKEITLKPTEHTSMTICISNFFTVEHMLYSLLKFLEIRVNR